MTTHSKLPWRRVASNFNGDVGIAAPGCVGVIAEVYEEVVAAGVRQPEVAEANAEFIVKACNGHDALLEAAREAFRYFDEVADADNGVPNREMQLLCVLDDAIKEAS